LSREDNPVELEALTGGDHGDRTGTQANQAPTCGPSARPSSTCSLRYRRPRRINPGVSRSPSPAAPWLTSSRRSWMTGRPPGLGAGMSGASKLPLGVGQVGGCGGAATSRAASYRGQDRDSRGSCGLFRHPLGRPVCRWPAAPDQPACTPDRARSSATRLSLMSPAEQACRHQGRQRPPSPSTPSRRRLKCLRPRLEHVVTLFGRVAASSRRLRGRASDLRTGPGPPHSTRRPRTIRR
jgi:hypothetical protein